MKVVPPADSSSKSNGDVIVIDEDSESEGDEKRFVFLSILMFIFLPFCILVQSILWTRALKLIKLSDL